MDELLLDFFTYKTEMRVNKEVLYFKEDEKEVNEYICRLLEIPLREYIGYVYSYPSDRVISSKDVIQFSDFNNATIEICKKIKKMNNPGMKFEEIGRLLLDDGRERSNAAYIKYGENHIKTANSFGLAFEFYNTYYLSSMGYAFVEISENSQKMLLDRLIIRSSLIYRTIQASQNGIVNMREILNMLANSTYVRRRSNIKKVLEYLYKSKEYDFESIEKAIRF